MRLILPFLTFISLFLISACSSDKTPALKESEVIEIDSLDLYPFMDFERHGIARPGDIQIMENGNVIVADGSIMKITIVDEDGNLIKQFGKEGKGPAEFIRLTQIELTPGKINIVDRRQNKVLEFDEAGEFIDSYLYEGHGFFDQVALLDNRRYFTEAGGVNNNLLLLTNANTDSTMFFGVAKGNEVDVISMGKSRKDILNGQVPAFLKNMVLIESDDKFVYAFLESYSELHKYDMTGNLIWEKRIKLPDNTLLEEQVIERVKKSKNGLPILRYTYDFLLVDDAIFILGAKVTDNPQHLVKVNKDGNIKTIYQFTNPDFTASSFALNPDSNILYLSSEDGLVYSVAI